jgi:hypothetical protein
MIVFYLLAALVGLVVYALTFRLRAKVRVTIALLIFLIPTISITVLLAAIGDKAPPGSVTWTRDQLPSGKPPAK